MADTVTDPRMPLAELWDGTPVLPAYRLGSQLHVWCTEERTWHYHGSTFGTFGSGDGHRVAHCTNPRNANGYVLHEVGELTPDIKRLARERQ